MYFGSSVLTCFQEIKRRPGVSLNLLHRALPRLLIRSPPQQLRADIRVILQQVTVRDPQLRPEKLLQIRQPDGASAGFEVDLLLGRGNLNAHICLILQAM